ncbi:MAG: hypothetical protein JXR73_00700 [Candidatus Omnitrophica bacterium]|nr:hypothetical protein [Candidatus Omnitrophota bacterium]
MYNNSRPPWYGGIMEMKCYECPDAPSHWMTLHEREISASMSMNGM